MNRNWMRDSFLIFNWAERRIKIYDDDYHYFVDRFFIFCWCSSFCGFKLTRVFYVWNIVWFSICGLYLCVLECSSLWKNFALDFFWEIILWKIWEFMRKIRFLLVKLGITNKKNFKILKTVEKFEFQKTVKWTRLLIYRNS